MGDGIGTHIAFPPVARAVGGFQPTDRLASEDAIAKTQRRSIAVFRLGDKIERVVRAAEQVAHGTWMENFARTCFRMWLRLIVVACLISAPLPFIWNGQAWHYIC